MNKLLLQSAFTLIVCLTVVPQALAERSLAEIIATGTEDEIIDQLNKGLDPNTYIKYEGLGGAVPHWAAKNGYVKVFECMKAKHPGMNLNLAHINPADQSGSRWTPLHVAARNGKSEIFNWFKINCPDIDLNSAIIDGPHKGWTPLHLAAYCGKAEIFSWFKENFPGMNLNPSITDGDGVCKGWTPLHFAAYYDKYLIIRWFKANFPGMDLNPAITDGDYCGSTPSYYAAFEDHTEIVDLLSSTMLTPEKCCFLTFEQNDWNDGVSTSLLNAIVLKIPAIATPHAVKKLVEKFGWIKEYFNSGRFTMLASSPVNLIIIIPESLQDLGITIPDSEKQSPEPQIDITNIQNKYGFKNLHLLNPTLINSVIEGRPLITADQFNKLIELFESVMNSVAPHHQTRFYLDGHGSAGNTIGAIPIKCFNNFLRVLTNIDAEFLFISSCYAAGTNLLAIQAAIQEIKGLNYAIALQATHGGVTGAGSPNINAMFTKLNEFLKDPSWALEFASGEDKPRITISDVITSLGIKNSTSLPSIRLPGKTGFFRPIDEGNMEIITESRIVRKSVKKTLKLIAASKSPDKTVANAARQKLQKPLAIDLQIKPDIHYIQIFPMDLTDFKFVIQGQNLTKFISKQAGVAQHFIGAISYSSDEKDSELARKKFINKGFVNIFESEFPAESPKCWFIKSAELSAAGTTTIIKKLVIKLDRAPASKKCDYIGSYAYINHNGEFIISKEGGAERKVEKETYESTIKSWFDLTWPYEETLNEATGGVEITAKEKDKLSKGLSTNLRLINPQYQRTPDDLFKIFMADN